MHIPIEIPKISGYIPIHVLYVNGIIYNQHPDQHTWIPLIPIETYHVHIPSGRRLHNGISPCSSWVNPLSIATITIFNSKLLT